MKNKKADSQSYLIGLILFLALLVTFSYSYSYFKEGLEENSLREIRRQSVKKHTEAHLAGLDFSDELNFPIIKKDIKKGEEIQDLSVALVQDWSDLSKGEKEMFSTETEEQVYCVPGQYLRFKSKDKKITVPEYVEYMKTKKVNEIGAGNVIGDKNIYITEYLLGYTTDNTVFGEEMKALKEELGNKEYVTIVNDKELSYSDLKEEYAINTEYDYMTVSVFMKKGYWPKWLNSLRGTGAGVVGGTILGLVLVPFTGGGSLVITGVALGGGVTGGLIGYKTGSDKSADWDAGIFLVPNKADILKDLRCDILPARGETV
ncbi:MAG: hypothetical protein U9O94_03725 [Nanoarchaeota archaeon]|nr:hypothetical protein [Nanoarchaeota archaeon]